MRIQLINRSNRRLVMGTKIHRIERGQSLVEFCLMVIIITVILLGVLDLGRAYFTYMALLDAAGEGATYGSVNPDKWCNPSHDYNPTCPTDYDDSADPDNITYRVIYSAPEGAVVDWDQTEIEIQGETPIKPGKKLTVILTTNYQLLTPFVGSIVGSQNLPLKAQADAIVLSP